MRVGWEAQLAGSTHYNLHSAGLANLAIWPVYKVYKDWAKHTWSAITQPKNICCILPKQNHLMLFQVLKTLGDTLGLQLQLQLQPKVTLVIVMVVAIFASVNASPLVAKGKYLSRRFFLNSRRLVLPRPPPTSSLDTHCTDVIVPEESKEIEKSSSSKLQFVKVKRESSNQKAELIGKL